MKVKLKAKLFKFQDRKKKKKKEEESKENNKVLTKDHSLRNIHSLKVKKVMRIKEEEE